MNGNTILNTCIIVDYWKRRRAKGVYFLTHCHEDNIRGLTASWRLPIYTSPFNVWRLQTTLKVEPEYLKPLEVGRSHVIQNSTTGELLNVTLIDANHCPGSVMFLFQGSFGNILYTGDMRYTTTMLSNPALSTVAKNEDLDVLYIDNTFVSPVCDFPTREQVLPQILDIVRNHPTHRIMVGVKSLGKEEVLRFIALEFNEKIYVPAERLAVIQALQLEDVFTVNPEESRIHVVNFYSVSIENIQRWRTECPTVAVLLTALYHCGSDASQHPFRNLQNQGIYVLPYSDHSCFHELMEFVKQLRPIKILPIIQQHAETKNQNSHFYRPEVLNELSVIPQCMFDHCRSNTKKLIGHRSNRHLNRIIVCDKKSDIVTIQNSHISFPKTVASGEKLSTCNNQFGYYTVNKNCMNNKLLTKPETAIRLLECNKQNVTSLLDKCSPTLVSSSEPCDTSITSHEIKDLTNCPFGGTKLETPVQSNHREYGGLFSLSPSCGNEQVISIDTAVTSGITECQSGNKEEINLFVNKIVTKLANMLIPPLSRVVNTRNSTDAGQVGKEVDLQNEKNFNLFLENKESCIGDVGNSVNVSPVADDCITSSCEIANDTQTVGVDHRDKVFYSDKQTSVGMSSDTNIPVILNQAAVNNECASQSKTQLFEDAAERGSASFVEHEGGGFDVSETTYEEGDERFNKVTDKGRVVKIEYECNSCKIVVNGISPLKVHSNEVHVVHTAEDFQSAVDGSCMKYSSLPQSRQNCSVPSEHTNEVFLIELSIFSDAVNFLSQQERDIAKIVKITCCDDCVDFIYQLLIPKSPIVPATNPVILNHLFRVCININPRRPYIWEKLLSEAEHAELIEKLEEILVCFTLSSDHTLLDIAKSKIHGSARYEASLSVERSAATSSCSSTEPTENDVSHDSMLVVDSHMPCCGVSRNMPALSLSFDSKNKGAVAVNHIEVKPEGSNTDLSKESAAYSIQDEQNTFEEYAYDASKHAADHHVSAMSLEVSQNINKTYTTDSSSSLEASADASLAAQLNEASDVSLINSFGCHNDLNSEACGSRNLLINQHISVNSVPELVDKFTVKNDTQCGEINISVLQGENIPMTLGVSGENNKGNLSYISSPKNLSNLSKVKNACSNLSNKICFSLKNNKVNANQLVPCNLKAAKDIKTHNMKSCSNKCINKFKAPVHKKVRFENPVLLTPIKKVQTRAQKTSVNRMQTRTNKTSINKMQIRTKTVKHLAYHNCLCNKNYVKSKTKTPTIRKHRRGMKINAAAHKSNHAMHFTRLLKAKLKSNISHEPFHSDFKLQPAAKKFHSLQPHFTETQIAHESFCNNSSLEFSHKNNLVASSKCKTSVSLKKNKLTQIKTKRLKQTAVSTNMTNNVALIKRKIKLADSKLDYVKASLKKKLDSKLLQICKVSLIRLPDSIIPKPLLSEKNHTGSVTNISNHVNRNLNCKVVLTRLEIGSRVS